MNPRPQSSSSRGLRRPHLPGTLISLLRVETEKRHFYRVPQTENPPLWVGVWGPNGTPCVGQCTDISFGGAGVRFPVHQDPRLEAGQEVALSFQSSARPGALQTTANVRTVRPLEAAGLRYGFQFTNPAEIAKRIDPAWARYFNRRHLLRAVPENGVGLWVCLRWTRGELHARVMDLSLGGLAATVPNDRADELEKGAGVHVSLQLPGETKVMRARAVIRSKQPLVGEVRIGMEFSLGGGIEEFTEILQRCIERRMSHERPAKSPRKL